MPNSSQYHLENEITSTNKAQADTSSWNHPPTQTPLGMKWYYTLMVIAVLNILFYGFYLLAILFDPLITFYLLSRFIGYFSLFFLAIGLFIHVKFMQFLLKRNRAAVDYCFATTSFGIALSLLVFMFEFPRSSIILLILTLAIYLPSFSYLKKRLDPTWKQREKSKAELFQNISKNKQQKTKAETAQPAPVEMTPNTETPETIPASSESQTKRNIILSPLSKVEPEVAPSQTIDLPEEPVPSPSSSVEEAKKAHKVHSVSETIDLTTPRNEEFKKRLAIMVGVLALLSAGVFGITQLLPTSTSATEVMAVEEPAHTLADAMARDENKILFGDYSVAAYYEQILYHTAQYGLDKTSLSYEYEEYFENDSYTRDCFTDSETIISFDKLLSSSDDEIASDCIILYSLSEDFMPQHLRLYAQGLFETLDPYRTYDKENFLESIESYTIMEEYEIVYIGTHADYGVAHFPEFTMIYAFLK